MQKFWLLGFGDSSNIVVLPHLSHYVHSVHGFAVSSSLLKDVVTCL